MLSGVNRGRNAGEDVIYSGTVAGAVEGTILGIPSFAVAGLQGRSGERPHWATAVRFGPDIVRRVLAAGILTTCSSTSISGLPAGRREGIAVTTQGRNRQERLQIEARHDGRGLHTIGSRTCACAACRQPTAAISPRSPTIA